ncbi:MAG TPA: LEA type 2 family protein, partial [Luteimonas sp.]|nr:LEA type 2 family protein [Luteimonas sp.]
DGSWSADLRIENFSSIPMRFDSIALVLTVGGESAGTLQAQPALSIGPESADVATVTLKPSPAARIVIADALARSHSITYTLNGTLAAAPEGGGVRNYKIKRDNTLNPVPGLAGVLR